MDNKKLSTKKLKAIVFTDIVNFTKIASEDEELALKIIDKQREILKPIVLNHQGEWLKEIGDGLLCSFNSSLDAVKCSIEIQDKLKLETKFQIRIGIHQGDIFLKDGDVYGDDVNIASRVEGFSPIGGISISDKVYKDIQGVKDIKTSFIGHKPLKGVKQETKVRCITSNNLPKSKGNLFPKIIGFFNIYTGIIVGIFALASIYVLISGDYNDEANFTYSRYEAASLLTYSLVNLSIVLLLFGVSTLSYHRGVSIFSQKLIYYIGAIYSTVLIYFFAFRLGITATSDDGEVINITPIFLTVIILVLLFGFFILPKIFKKIRKI
tara:strand:+ start:184 stop:1152 length:969 start_codon:yes stop_codon:yes gene_type:complete